MGSKSFKIAFTLGLIASAAFGAPACSSDEEPANPGGSGPGGSSGTGATGGSGGASGSAGRGGTSGSGTGGTAGSGDVTCGTNVCHPALDGFVEACCATGNKCGLVPPDDLGLQTNCVEVNQQGNPDPTCYPDSGVPIDAGGIDAGNLLDGGVFVIQGCCRPDGKCGALLNFPDQGVNFGCVDPTQYLDAGQAPPSCTP